MDGVIGEFCVAKSLNLCPDFSVNPRSGGEDLRAHSGKTIDVKTTRNVNGNLVATLNKTNSQSDIYILATVDDYGCNIDGWIYKEDLFVDKNIKNLGHGNTYFFAKENLNKDLKLI